MIGGTQGTAVPPPRPAQVSALVVTYNRKDLLRACLDAILAQTRRPDRIVVIDNGSVDGTEAFLRDHGYLDERGVTLLRLSPNRGPAFAFSAGFEEFQRSGADWLWVMDDDVLPEPMALAELLAAAGEVAPPDQPPGFLVSTVRAPTGAMMNVPDPDMRRVGDGYADWNRLLQRGLVKVRKATFVSILVPARTVREFGVPSPDFYMWGEDVDYTLRVTARRPGWLVGASRVQHLRANPKPPGVMTETDPARVPMLFYYYRNILGIRRRHYGPVWFAAQWVVFLKAGWRAFLVRPFDLGRVAAVWGGLLSGLFFRAREEACATFDAFMRPERSEPVPPASPSSQQAVAQGVAHGAAQGSAFAALSSIAAPATEPVEALLNFGRRSPSAHP